MNLQIHERRKASSIVSSTNASAPQLFLSKNQLSQKTNKHFRTFVSDSHLSVNNQAPQEAPGRHYMKALKKLQEAEESFKQINHYRGLA